MLHTLQREIYIYTDTRGKIQLNACLRSCLFKDISRRSWRVKRGTTCPGKEASFSATTAHFNQVMHPSVKA